VRRLSNDLAAAGIALLLFATLNSAAARIFNH
jgi:hypothetical protein